MESKTGAAVRWLPMAMGEDDGLAIELPCPATELIRLVCLSTVENPQKQLHQLLRLNPALLIFALAQYQLDHGTPPTSAGDLVEWCHPELYRAISQVEIQADLVPKRFSNKRFKSQLEFFLRARSNRKLRKSLQQFLRTACGVNKPASKSIIGELVGKKLRAEHFKCKRVRRKETLSYVAGQWLESTSGDVDVGSLFELARSNLEMTAHFEARLQDEKLASMKQLAYGASHEINNPLANIATRAQTMLAIEEEPEKRHKLSVIYEQAIRAHEMISDMMLFAHPPALDRRRVSVRLLFSRIVHELQPEFENAPEIDLQIYIGAGIDQVQLDPTQFTVAIMSLIQNSIEALQSSNERFQQIEIRIERAKSSELQFSIWDNGQAISDEVAGHMFDPFYSGREAGRGLGFGLSKVWTIAKLHGGRLAYDSRSSQGTRFVLSLPDGQPNMSDSPASSISIRQTGPVIEEEAA